MKLRSVVALLLLIASVVTPALQAQTYHSLQAKTGFGPAANGQILADGSVPFLTTGTIQRGLARNPVTGNLILVDRGVAGQTATVSGNIYVLDGASGAVLSTLSTNGIAGGSFAHYAVGVAEDGAVYVANVIVDTNAGPFKVYRWDSESTTNDPMVAFSGALSTNNLRWGNTIDVRGSGTASQILVSSGGAEAAILTTTDGINFTSTNLIMDVTGTLQGSLAFGIGNTFWAKWNGVDLHLLNYNLATRTAASIRIYGGIDMPELVAPEIAAVDNTQNLLAVVNHHGSNPDEVLFYSLARTNDLPQLLDAYTITAINNANAGSPNGYLAMGAGNLYYNELNNGVFAFDLLSNSIPAPSILGQPQSASVLAGSTVRFRVISQRGFGFQWLKGVTPISGATNSTYSITNAQAADIANYSVVVSNASGSINSSNALLAVLSLADSYHLTQIWSTAPGAQPYFLTTGGVAATPNQRSLAYNALSNHLYVVSRASSSSANVTIGVINADTGAQLYTLNTNGVNFSGFVGQIPVVGIDVSADGSIYACNVDSSTPNAWRLYRWADGNSNTLPVQVFVGDPLNSGGNSRWGDNLSVRGSGLNTEIIIDTQAANPGYMAILRPTDSTMNTFTSSFWFPGNTAGTTVGRSLQFGAGNTFWQKRKGTPLVVSSYSTDNQIAGVLATYTNFPANLGLVAVDETKKLVGAVNMSGVTASTPDTADLYEISDLNNPALLSRINFPINKASNTGNIGKVIFGGNKMFALESQNGVVAFRVDLGITVSPVLSISRGAGSVQLSWQGNGFILEGNTDLSTTNWQSIPYDPGATNSTTDLITNSARFYRLRK